MLRYGREEVAVVRVQGWFRGVRMRSLAKASLALRRDVYFYRAMVARQRATVRTDLAKVLEPIQYRNG